MGRALLKSTAHPRGKFSTNALEDLGLERIRNPPAQLSRKLVGKRIHPKTNALTALEDPERKCVLASRRFATPALPTHAASRARRKCAMHPRGTESHQKFN